MLFWLFSLVRMYWFVKCKKSNSQLFKWQKVIVLLRSGIRFKKLFIGSVPQWVCVLERQRERVVRVSYIPLCILVHQPWAERRNIRWIETYSLLIPLSLFLPTPHIPFLNNTGLCLKQWGLREIEIPQKCISFLFHSNPLLNAGCCSTAAAASSNNNNNSNNNNDLI